MLRTLAICVAIMTIAACSPDASSCFSSDFVSLPKREAVLAHVTNGEAGRDIAAAVLDGEDEAVRRLAGADPGLLQTHVPPVEYPNSTPDGQYGDLLTFAVSRCDAEMVNTLLELGLSPNGALYGYALELAVQANSPELPALLLEAGADPDPQKKDMRAYPMHMASLLANPAAARLLIEYGADLDWANQFGRTALQHAVDQDSMTVAEVLIEAGADPWRVSNGGGLPAFGIYEPLLLTNEQEEAARTRLIEKLKADGVAWPPPNPAELRRLILAGEWPNAEQRAAGAPPVPDSVLEDMRASFNPDGTPKRGG